MIVKVNEKFENGSESELTKFGNENESERNFEN